MDNTNETPPTVLAPRKSPTYGSTEELATFHIGKGLLKETFVVHKEVACLYSPVLKATFNFQFTEGQAQTYTIDDMTKEVFQLFVQWLDNQKLEPFAAEAETDSVRSEVDWEVPSVRNPFSRSIKHQTSLAGLWILADKFCIPTIQNLVADDLELTRKMSSTSRTSDILFHCFKYVYEHTLPGDEISDNKPRYLILMQAMYHNYDFTFKVFSHFFPREMLIDYILLSITMDKTSLRDIFSKTELF